MAAEREPLGSRTFGDLTGSSNRSPLMAPPAVVASTGVASILIPCCGQLEYTKLCVPSLLRNTRGAFDLVFLGIGSLDGTAEYLAGVKAATRHGIEILRTPTDLGLGGLVQQALAKARGEYLVLLNNDTLVPEGWLEQLIALAKLSQTIGLVGPMSNYAAPPQVIEKVPYRVGLRKGKPSSSAEALVDAEAVEAFARQLQEEQRGKWVEADRLGGFCLLIKREVLAKIGPLESEEGLGLFDTDQLSMKARRAGYTLAVCRDLFVHHFGSRTFAHGAPAPTADLRG